MKCPKCSSTNINEYRIDVVIYEWYEDPAEEGDEEEDTIHCDEVTVEETLLPLGAYCRDCDYSGGISKFGLDRRDLIGPIQEDKEGKYVQYLLDEGKVKVYPKEVLLKDLQDNLKER